MGRHVEPLTGGLTTDRDPAQLNKGQLSYIRNMVYKQGATSLRVAPGRLAIATAATGTPRGGVYGLRDMQFDNGMHYLVAGVEDMYRYMDINNPGTFVTLASGVATGRNVESVQFLNRYYLMNGATSVDGALGTNLVAYLSATSTACAPTVRQAGLLPVETAPTVVTASGGSFSSTVTGWYEYWFTEVAKIRQDGVDITLESAYSNTTGPANAYVSATSIVPTITLPKTPRNGLATSYRVYRSPKKDIEADKRYPAGFMIGEFSTASSVVSDKSTAATATSLATDTSVTGSFPDGTTWSSVANEWASATRLTANDGSYASATSVLNTYQTGDAYQQAIYKFNFGSFKGVVLGIEAEIKGYVASGSAPIDVDITLGMKNEYFYSKLPSSFRMADSIVGGRATKTARISSTNSAAPTVAVVGSSSDRWVSSSKPGFTDDEINSDDFIVVLTVREKASKSLGVDYVKLSIYNGASVVSTVQYPAISYNFGGIVAQVGRNFPPPSSNTGDIFEDSLVVNDMNNRSLIRWSYPGEPESFPPPYYLDFETNENDVVTCIRTVNNKVVVGLENKLWRMNYLPSERDASFDRGKAANTISNQYGIVNPMCATTISIEGQSETLAFISNFGLHTTDGYNVVTRSKNLTWEYSGALGTPIALLNDTENRCLRVYYRQSTDPDKELCLWASYDRSDIDAEGNFKFSGPVSMANYSGGNYARLETAWNVIKSDGASRFYMGYSSGTAQGGGMVYSEYSDGLGTIPGYTSNYKYKTRRMYLNGIGGEWMVDDLYGYCGTYTGSPLLTYTLEGTKTNLSVASPVTTSKTITLSGQELHRTSPKISVEGLTVACTMTYPLSIDYGQESLVIGSKSLGYEDSGL